MFVKAAVLFWRLILLLLVSVTATQGVAASAADQQHPELLSLPVRVHIIQSDRLSRLDADIEQAQLEEMFEQANLIWKQAGIEWVIERVLELPASFENAYALAANPKSQLNSAQRLAVMRAVCGYQQPLLTGWNLCVVGRFADSAGGVYFTNANNSAVPRLAWPIENRFGRFNAATLAHELGHSLGLAHASNKQNNLMTGGGNNMRRKPGQLDKVILTPEEIETARRQALLGTATKTIGSASEN